MLKIPGTMDKKFDVNIRLFGICKDIVGSRELNVTVDPPFTVDDLLVDITLKYPPLAELRSLVVAINEEYSQGGQEILRTDKIALIPPVAGG